MTRAATTPEPPLTYPADHIHDLGSAAARAKVTPVVILRWIEDGLKATPVGRVGRRGPRDYRIFDGWLTEYMRSRATVTVPPAPAPAAAPGPPPARGPKPDGGRRWPKPVVKKPGQGGGA